MSHFRAYAVTWLTTYWPAGSSCAGDRSLARTFANGRSIHSRTGGSSWFADTYVRGYAWAAAGDLGGREAGGSTL